MQKLILIDGNAIIHRAYHALPPLSKDGVVVNAVYGFFAMFLKIMQEQKPDFVAVCFDKTAPTFRQQMYAGYHENRASIADDLAPQFGIIYEVLEKTRVPIFGVEGYEADDLIGTLAWQAVQDTKILRYKDIKKKDKKEEKKSPNIEAIIVTGDRDMLQLVNAHVKVLMPIIGITKMNILGEKDVEEKYGVKPSEFVDYKALIGDASDNYPGVSGIGPKTAAQLIQKFHTIENMYAHLYEIPEKIAHRLAADAEQAALAKKLATIVTNAPITLDLAVCKTESFDFEAMKSAFQELGIKSLQDRVPVYQNEMKKSLAEANPVADKEKIKKQENKRKRGKNTKHIKKSQKKQDKQLGFF